MARVEIDYVFQSVTGQAIDGGQVYVYQRGTTTQVPVYGVPTGGSALTQPLSTTDGRVDGYVDPGSYDLVASKTGFQTLTQAWEANSASLPIILARTPGTSSVLTAKVSGDANDRLVVWADGSLHWSDGTAAPDTGLRRIATGALQLGEAVDHVLTFAEKGVVTAWTPDADVGNRVYGVGAWSDAQYRFRWNGDGKLEWGAGTGAPDVSLKRDFTDAFPKMILDQLLVVGDYAASNVSIDSAGIVFVTERFENNKSGGSIVLKAPNGTRYAVTVTNAGTLAVALA